MVLHWSAFLFDFFTALSCLLLSSIKVEKMKKWLCLLVALLVLSGGSGQEQELGFRKGPRLGQVGLARARNGPGNGRGQGLGRNGPGNGEKGAAGGGGGRKQRKKVELDIDQMVNRMASQRKKFRTWATYASENLISDMDASNAAQDFFQQFYNAERVCSSSSWSDTSLSYSNRGAGEGLGSLLNGYVISAMWALVKGKRLCAHESMTFYVSAETCPSQTWDCLFKSVSEGCPCQDIAAEKEEIPQLRNKRCYLTPAGTQETEISNGIGYSVYDSIVGNPDLEDKIKVNLPRRNDQWYMAQLYYYYLRPNDELESYLNMLKRSLFPDWDPSRTISVHIRRGDHWMGGHLDDEAYMSTIRRVAETTKADTVFLGSDDFEVLRTFPDKLAPLRVLSLPANYTILNELKDSCKGRSKGCKAANYLKTNTKGTDEGKLLMAQIYLMKETLVTIGTIGSNFGRVIHQLQWADKASKTSTVSPSVHFLDMEGDYYFACGWRLSQHQARDNKVVVEEWVQKWKYWND